jgi:hypothetical protein
LAHFELGFGSLLARCLNDLVQSRDPHVLKELEKDVSLGCMCRRKLCSLPRIRLIEKEGEAECTEKFLISCKFFLQILKKLGVIGCCGNLFDALVIREIFCQEVSCKLHEYTLLRT